jgi:mono/diheme cytochrome c family protein
MSNEPLLPPDSSQDETSILAIHKTVMEETPDPHEAIHVGPRWFYYFIVAALIFGSFYLGRHMGEYGTQTHIGFLSQGQETSPAEPDGKAEAQPAAAASVSGANLYQSRCSTCHQADGKGVPGVFPPLIDSPYVTEDPTIPVAIVLKGLQGPLHVNGKDYNGLMPAWADQMNDAEIAAVVSHIRGKLEGNKADPVEGEFVARLREELKGQTAPYTADELKNVGAKQ